ncbi:MAG: FAD-binding monooxygenase [Beijerinckiaceae bacterium]
MQFHGEAYEPGDPEQHDPAERFGSTGAAGTVPAEVDVLIVGCGPAGLTLAAQLAAFPDIRTCIVEQKSGRLFRGQADGVACRTVEMFQAFGFAERVLREAYWVNETAFWKPNAKKPAQIARSGRIDDTEDGLSEFPHVILNQARVHDFYLDVMRKSPAGLLPHYGRKVLGLTVDAAGGPYPVTVTLERNDPSHEGQAEVVRARYVVGCDGARSAVRQSIGLTLEGDSANKAWGVMDVLAVTDFPDIRLKCLVQSAAGSMVIIPREGGHLVRLYVEMETLAAGERVKNRNITAEQLIDAARKILSPHSLDVKEVAWWSVYEIGQRLSPKFDDVPAGAEAKRAPRVFIAGDACHTHSPKAGQGMNVSMQDAFNLGWKLAAVLRGRSAPEILHSYSAERQAIASELIDFDREWSKMLSAAAKPMSAGGVDPAEVQTYFVRHGRYTAGTATRYRPGLFTGAAAHQTLAKGFEIGTRFHSAPVIRLADAKPMQLGQCGVADGRWRLYAFAGEGDAGEPGSPLERLCGWLAAGKDSPVVRFTPKGADIDAVIDLRAVFQRGHRDMAVQTLPPLLLPAKGKLGLRDYEKAFCPDPKRGDVFDLRGIDRKNGCLVIVRPDQYVAEVLPLGARKEIAAFFGRFMLRPGKG